MNIVFLSYTYLPESFGGELILSVERFEELCSRGYDVSVITSGVVSNLKNTINRGILIRRSPFIHETKLGRLLRRLIFPLWAGFRLVIMRYDVLHIGSPGGIDPITITFGMLLLVMISKIKGAKTVWVHSLADTESEMFSNRGLSNKLRNFWLSQVNRIVSVSPALAEGVYSVFPNKSDCIMNAVRDDLFTFPTHESKKLIRSHFQTSDEDIVIVFLGSVTKRKGFDILTQSYFELSSNYPNLKLWVIGPKSKVENQNLVDSEVNLLINELTEKTSCIRFFGKIEDRTLLASILSSSDIFVFPTRREGMPLAPGEAMACGLPVVISRIPGATDVMNVEGETGYFCEPGNVESLTYSIKKLVDNPQLRYRMGQNARRRIVENFGWQKHIDEWEALYKSLVDEE